LRAVIRVVEHIRGIVHFGLLPGAIANDLSTIARGLLGYCDACVQWNQHLHTLLANTFNATALFGQR
jgi:hypothetical protein